MATKANLIIDQGSTFSTTIDLTDQNDEGIDLTGYTGAGQIRKTYTSSSYTNLTIAIGASGQVTLSLTPAQTANLVAGRYLYDVELTSSGGVVTRVVEGIVTVNPQITKNATTGF